MASVPAPDPLEREADERERLADDRERDVDERERLADGRDRAADQRERLADERELDADQREQLADERERHADQRERLADERDREADARERLADERERMAADREQVTDRNGGFDELARDLGIQAADARRRATVAMEHSRAMMAATIDRLKRSEAALQRMEANATRARMYVGRTASERQRELARQSPLRVQIERAEVLRRRLSVMAAALAEAGEALAQIQDELAGHHPIHAREFRNSASQARKAAHWAREIERQFND